MDALIFEQQQATIKALRDQLKNDFGYIDDGINAPSLQISDKLWRELEKEFQGQTPTFIYKVAERRALAILARIFDLSPHNSGEKRAAGNAVRDFKVLFGDLNAEGIEAILEQPEA